MSTISIKYKGDTYNVCAIAAARLGVSAGQSVGDHTFHALTRATGAAGGAL